MSELVAMPDRNGYFVLNHGHIALVSYMQPDVQAPGWTPDMEVVRNARVSYDNVRATGENAEADSKLLKYLLKNRHTSPFEAMVFTFDIKCPLFVARQWHRHRTWAYSEVSARYSVLPEEFYVPEVSSITHQSASNKQMRTLEEHPQAELIQRMVLTQCESAFHTYHQLLDMGTPRELARGVLPLNTYTHFFGTVNLNNLLKFFDLRDHDHAQPEVRVYAQGMLKIVGRLCVETIKHYRDLKSQVA